LEFVRSRTASERSTGSLLDAARGDYLPPVVVMMMMMVVVMVVMMMMVMMVVVPRDLYFVAVGCSSLLFRGLQNSRGIGDGLQQFSERASAHCPIDFIGCHRRLRHCHRRKGTDRRNYA